MTSALVLFLSCTATTFSLDKSVYRPEETIRATWSGSSGGQKYWVGFYPTPGNAPIRGKSNGPATLWKYCDGKANGSLTFDKSGLPPGQYVAHLLKEDGYVDLAPPIKFRILPPPGAKPRFLVGEIHLRHAVTSQPYLARISGYAVNVDSFAKVTGPSWVKVSADGLISGTPGSKDSGDVRLTLSARMGTEKIFAQASFNVQPKGKEKVSSLSVLSYNVWVGLGGVKDGLRKGLESIVQADVDMVGIVEPGQTPQVLGEKLGWHHDPDGFISKYPFTKLSSGSGFSLYRVTVAESPRKQLIVGVCHFDYQHYVPYLAQKKGTTTEMLMAEENASQRPRQYREFVAAAAPYLNNTDREPVVVMGDFNTASHLDWTEANRKNHAGHALDFPGSILFEKAGLIDTYRTLHPDPAKDPGVTWSPIYVGDEPRDRIDFVYSKGERFKPRESKVYVTKVESTASSWLATGNGATEAIRNNTWPSDHAAVLTRFRWLP